MVARRVGARDQRQVGLLEVLEAHRRGAGAVHPIEGDARGGMTVERAVVDICGTEGACDELEEEGSLVARPARGVEEHLARRRRAQGSTGTVERLRPADATEVRVV